MPLKLIPLKPGQIEVVAALLERAGQYLLARRKTGEWEFPGGKREEGETLEEALVRELEEELGIVAEADPPLTTIDYDYPDRSIRLHLLPCRVISGEPEPLDCLEVAWSEPGQLSSYDLLEADRRLVRWLTIPY